MFIKTIALIIRPFLRLLDMLTPIADLIARIWVAQIFFRDGILKLQNWNDTVDLYNNMSFIPPSGVAGLVIALEIVLPILLIIGFGGRIMIFIFFIFNGIMMYTYNLIWTPESGMSFEQQMAWELLLVLLMCHGPGLFSVDHWLSKRHGHHLKPKK